MIRGSSSSRSPLIVVKPSPSESPQSWDSSSSSVAGGASSSAGLSAGQPAITRTAAAGYVDRQVRQWLSPRQRLPLSTRSADWRALRRRSRRRHPDHSRECPPSPRGERSYAALPAASEAMPPPGRERSNAALPSQRRTQRCRLPAPRRERSDDAFPRAAHLPGATPVSSAGGWVAERRRGGREHCATQVDNPRGANTATRRPRRAVRTRRTDPPDGVERRGRRPPQRHQGRPIKGTWGGALRSVNRSTAGDRHEARIQIRGPQRTEAKLPSSDPAEQSPLQVPQGGRSCTGRRSRSQS